MRDRENGDLYDARVVSVISLLLFVLAARGGALWPLTAALGAVFVVSLAYWFRVRKGG